MTFDIKMINRHMPLMHPVIKFFRHTLAARGFEAGIEAKTVQKYWDIHLVILLKI